MQLKYLCKKDSKTSSHAGATPIRYNLLQYVGGWPPIRISLIEPQTPLEINKAGIPHRAIK